MKDNITTVLTEIDEQDLKFLNQIWNLASDDVRKLFYNNLGDNFINK